MANFLDRLQTGEGFELYVQNILPGPLVIPDLQGLPAINKWEPIDLSSKKPETLLESVGLRIAMRKGFLRELDRREYEEQRDLYELRVSREFDDHMEDLEADGIAIDVDMLDTGTNPRGYKRTSADLRAEARSRRAEAMNDPEVYAKKYAEAASKFGAEDPEIFKEMVDNNEIKVGPGGRKVRGVPAYDPEEYARQAAAQGYKEVNAGPRATVMTEDGKTVSTRMGNLNRDGVVPGAPGRVPRGADDDDMVVEQIDLT
jgi:hypothetical protein